MKRIAILFALLINAIASFAQKECSHLKSNQKQLKSNTLSIAQIEETEQYNVHYYSLDLALTNTSTSISGIVEIHAVTLVNLDSALFELYNSFTISQIRVNGNTINYSRIRSAIHVPINLPINSSFIIAIDYNGTSPTSGANPMGGSGLTSKIDPTYLNQVTASLSQPFSAYEWWPCKQSLTDKADSSTVKMTVPSTCKAGSNGLLKNTINLGNGLTRYEWKQNHPIDYYLISVAVAEYLDYSIYATPEGTTHPILIQNFIYNNPQCLIDQKENIDLTAAYIDLFSKLFGLYPFYDEKYGHCLAPIGGGMEHQTMTTQSHFDKNLTAHELGHSWWGNNVTCGSWSDIWINEGFATYSQYLMLENIFPNERRLQMEQYHSSAMQYLDGSVYVKDTLNTKRIFEYRLTYAKGAAIINTLRFIINNDSLFFKGLRDFQIKYKGGTAKCIDFKNSMENTTNINLTNFFNEWYYGEGYPTYKIKWNCINKDLSIQIGQYPSGAFLTQKFTSPLEISFSRDNLADTTIRFDIQELSNSYLIPQIGKVKDIKKIDPYNWLINNEDSIIFDAKFEIYSDSINSSYKSVIKVFPNPTDSYFEVYTKTAELHSITISDLMGKIIDEQQFTKAIKFDSSFYINGIYIIKVKSEFGATEFFKLIKK